MKISESRLKQIVKEETNKVLQEFEYIPGTGALLFGALASSISLLTYFIARILDKKEEVKRDKEIAKFNLEFADEFLHIPEIVEILKKFADPDDPINQSIFMAISDSNFKKAKEEIEASGRLSEEDIKKLSAIVEKMNKEANIKRYRIASKFDTGRSSYYLK